MTAMNLALAEQHGIPRVEAHQIADAHTTKDFRGKLDTIFPDGPGDDATRASFTDILNGNENAIDAINRFAELEPTRLEKVMEEVQALELEVSTQEPVAPQNNSSGLEPA